MSQIPADCTQQRSRCCLAFMWHICCGFVASIVCCPLEFLEKEIFENALWQCAAKRPICNMVLIPCILS
ncbi:hypothetical protein HPP92_001978 [Vanilla planifolia]|uniref:Uncharacterized protein n=1 Tax=Vanilla planifolia TaxID=51239 RepID=A0A835S0W4_VANPL|nr:hypothetical protein HPP92_001978 [Vanilla planifolia]